MKTIQKWNGLLLSIVIPVILLCAACSDPLTDTENNGNDTTDILTGDEADRIFDSFKFRNSLKVTGSVPSVLNTSLVRTSSKDTIYTMPGLKIPIRISNSTSVAVGGWYIAVKNSTFYHDITLDDEEDSDTVSVVFVEIDPGDMDVPFSVPVEITPYDENKVPIDIITRIITVEEPSASDCDILVDGDTATFFGPPEWIWYSTVLFDHNDEPIFVNAPAREFGANQEPTGCCADAPACPALVRDKINPNKFIYEYDSKVTAHTSYSIDFEFFTFFKNGTFIRVTAEHIKNFDPAATDWCSGIPAYNDRESLVEYFGTHDYAPGDSRISYGSNRSVCADPLGICGYGSRPGALMHSCHLMVITAGAEGSKEVRMYERYSGSDAWSD